MNLFFWCGNWQPLSRSLVMGGAITITGCNAFVFEGNYALAQITPDSTLGAERSVVTPDVNIKGIPADRIDGGATRGTSLFHSFSEFNILDGQRVYFASPVRIENILTRVTGSNLSNILGTLGVEGGANLFLLNPNGIIFGPNARLDIAGSFFASTADSVVFNNGYQFSAAKPDVPQLLTINVPLGLQYGRVQPAAIVNAGKLTVGQGQNLGLSGGTVVSTGQLSAPGGQISVATLPSIGVLVGSSSSLSELLLAAGGGQNLGLTVTRSGSVELTGSGLPVADGDIAIAGGKGFASLQTSTATLSAAHNLTLVNSQLSTTGNLNLLARDTVRVRDSLANRFSAQAGGNLYVKGNQGIDILALNHPGNAFESGGNLSLVSDGIISGDAHFASGGSFSILNLLGKPGNFVSLYDPIISSVGDVVLGDYTGVALKIESMGSITTGNITITGRDTTLASGSDPDIEILSSEPALILKAGVSELNNLPNVLQLAGGTTITSSGNLSLPGSITVGNISTAGESSVNFSDFSNISNLTLNNNAQQAGNVLRLTPNQNSNGGSAFLTSPFLISDNTSFQTQFQFRLHADDNSLSKAADGFVFIIQNDLRGASALGETGGSLGYSALSDTSNPGLKILPSLAVEFDIYQNSEYSDPNDNHVALLRDGFVNHSQLGLPVKLSPFKLDNGNSNTAWIDYDGRTNEIKVFVSENSTKPDQPLLSAQIDLSSVVGSQGFVGFSAATGASFSNHDIENWQFNIINRGASDLGGQVILSAAGDIQTSSITSHGGNISLNSGGEINAVGAKIDSTNNNGTGKSGDINITARTLSLTDGARLLSRAVGNSQGGNITVKTTESVRLSGSSVGGDSSGLFAVTDETGSGNAGKVIVETPELILQGRARILTEAYSVGNAGELSIYTDRLILRDGARISALTSGQGKGGNLDINASEFVELSGTSADGKLPSALSSGSLKTGDAGNLTIQTPKLVVRDGAVVTVSTVEALQGGNLTVNANSVELIGTSANAQISSGLYSDTTGAGNAGNLTINTGQLIVRNGAAASASTAGTGQGGHLSVTAESVELSGTGNNGFASGLYAQAFGDGNAGNLTIHTQDLIVRDGAKVTVAAGTAAGARVPNLPSFNPNNPIVTFDPDATGTAGNITVTAGSIFLDNQGKIIAQTDSSEGGNIALNVQDILLMRHNSLISATAGTAQAGGNGGNITINAPFIVAVPKENSDITANAFLGNGGRIQITAQEVYGLKFRPHLTPRSDITASSELGVNGVVEINTPGVDAARGLGNLPAKPGVPEPLEGCQPRGLRKNSSFVNTGRGGLSPNPTEPLSSNEVWRDVQLPTQLTENSTNAAQAATSPTKNPGQIVEAQGWIIDEKGNVELVAEMPSVTAQEGCRLR